MDLVLETANKMCYSRHPRRGDNRGSPSTQTGEVGHHAPYAWEIESRDLVIIPSMSFAPKELTTIEGIAHYEERALYAIFGLSDPNTRLIIVTTTPLDEWIVKYHFSLLPSRKRENCRSRVQFYNVGDASPTRCLTEKLLDRPRLLSRLKQDATTMTNGKRPQRTLLVYRSTVHEENLSKLLGLPYYSARPEFAIHGTKPGSRKIFRDLGIPCADGTYEAERNLKAFQKSIWKVLRKNPHAKKAVVKLADGFSGIGNAIMDLRLIQNRLFQISESIQDTDEALCRLTAEAFESMIFHRHTWQDFSEELEEMGAIFELFIDLPEELRACKQRTITNPSVQAVINEDGSVTVLSTHEQILNEQVYLGCEFPCLGDYRLQVIEYGQKIGEYLSRRGVKDRFGVDFMCVPRDNAGWNIYAVEINLRLTGTTHPWMTMKLLTHGNMDPSTGSFVTPSGTPKFYVSSDHVSDPAFTKLVPQDLYEIMMARKDLHWDPNKQTGTVFHMLGLLSDCGTVSMTAISNSLEDARKLFEETFSYLVSEARRDSCF